MGAAILLWQSPLLCSWICLSRPSGAAELFVQVQGLAYCLWRSSSI